MSGSELAQVRPHTTELTREERLAAIKVLHECPMVALPNGGMFIADKVKTFEDVLRMTEGIIGSLKDEMAKRIETEEQLDRLKRDLKTAGSVLKLMMSDDE